MQKGVLPMENLLLQMIFHNIQRQIFLVKLAKKQKHFCVFPPLQEREARQMQNEMCEDLHSNFIQMKGIGISWGITHLYFLLKMQLNSLILSIHKKETQRQICVAAQQRGIFGVCTLKAYIK